MGAVADLYVKVHADTSEFSKELQTKLGSATGLSGGGAVGGFKGVGTAAVIGAFTAIAYKSYHLLKSNSKALQGILSYMQGSIGTAVDMMTFGILSLFQSFSPAMVALQSPLEDTRDVINTMTSLLKDDWGPLISSFFTTQIPSMVSLLDNMVARYANYIQPGIVAISDYFTTNGSTIVERLAGISGLLVALENLYWIFNYGLIYQILINTFDTMTTVGGYINSVLSAIGLSESNGVWGTLTSMVTSLTHILEPLIAINGILTGSVLGALFSISTLLSPMFWMEKLGVLDVVARFLEKIAALLGYEKEKSDREYYEEYWRKQYEKEGLRYFEEYNVAPGITKEKIASLRAQGYTDEQIFESLLAFMFKMDQEQKAREQRNPGGISQSYWGDTYNDYTTGGYM